MKGTEKPRGKKVAELTKRLKDKKRNAERVPYLSRRPKKMTSGYLITVYNFKLKISMK